MPDPQTVSGAVVFVALVYSKDEFAIRGANVPPLHEGDWFAEDGRGAVKGGYAYVSYGGDLYSLVVYMSEADFLKHRAKAQAKSVWDECPEAMRLKTLVHALQKTGTVVSGDEAAVNGPPAIRGERAR